MHRVLDSENVGHARVGLDDQRLRLFADRLVIGDRRAEVEKAVLVHRRRLQHREVDVDEAAIVVGRLAEVHRDMMREAAIVHLSFEPREIPRQVSEMTFVGIRLDRRARTHREASANFHAVERRHSRGERAIEQVRLPESESVLDPVAGFDVRRRLIGADLFALEFSLVGSRHLYALVSILSDSLDCAVSVGFSSTGVLQSMPSIEPIQASAHQRHRRCAQSDATGGSRCTLFAASYSPFTSSA